MKLAGYIFILILSSVTAGASTEPGACPAALGDYSTLISELARGYLLVEEMKVEGSVNDAAQKVSRRAFTQKRKELVKQIGSEEKFEALFAEALRLQGAIASKGQQEVRTQRATRLENESSLMGEWTAIKSLAPTSGVTRAIHSPDHKKIAVQNEQGEIIIVDAISLVEESRFTSEQSSHIEHFEFTADGENLLVSPRKGKISLFNIATQALKVVHDQLTAITAYKIIGDKIFVVDGNSLLVMNLSNDLLQVFKPEQAEANVKSIQSFAVSHDSKFIAIAFSDKILVYNFETGKVFSIISEGVARDTNWLQFSTDDEKLFSSDGDIYFTVKAWNWKQYENNWQTSLRKGINARVLKTLGTQPPPPPEIIHNGITRIFNYGAKETEVLVSDDNHFSALNIGPESWKIRIQVTAPHSADIISAEFSLDKKKLVVVTEDGFVYVWDLEHWQTIDRFRAVGAVSAEFDSTGRRVLVQSAKQIQIYTHVKQDTQ